MYSYVRMVCNSYYKQMEEICGIEEMEKSRQNLLCQQTEISQIHSSSPSLAAKKVEKKNFLAILLVVN